MQTKHCCIMQRNIIINTTIIKMSYLQKVDKTIFQVTATGLETTNTSTISQIVNTHLAEWLSISCLNSIYHASFEQEVP